MRWVTWDSLVEYPYKVISGQLKISNSEKFSKKTRKIFKNIFLLIIIRNGYLGFFKPLLVSIFASTGDRLIWIYLYFSSNRNNSIAKIGCSKFDFHKFKILLTKMTIESDYFFILFSKIILKILIVCKERLVSIVF